MEKNSESRRNRLFSADSVTVYIPPRAAYFRFNYEPKSRINRCLTENPIKHSFQTKPALKHLLSEILTLRSLHMCRAHKKIERRSTLSKIQITTGKLLLTSFSS